MMNREIKFRAWDKNTSEMLYDDDILDVWGYDPPPSHWTEPVVWDVEKACWCIDWPRDNRVEIGLCHWQHKILIPEIKGNIYENPDIISYIP